MSKHSFVARLGCGTQLAGWAIKVLDHLGNPVVAEIVKGADDPLQAQLDLPKLVRLEFFEGAEVCRPDFGNGFAGAIFEKTVSFLEEPELQLHFHAAVEARGCIFEAVLGGCAEGVVEELLKQDCVGRVV